MIQQQKNRLKGKSEGGLLVMMNFFNVHINQSISQSVNQSIT